MKSTLGIERYMKSAFDEVLNDKEFVKWFEFFKYTEDYYRAAREFDPGRVAAVNKVIVATWLAAKAFVKEIACYD